MRRLVCVKYHPAIVMRAHLLKSSMHMWTRLRVGGMKATALYIALALSRGLSWASDTVHATQWGRGLFNFQQT